MNDVRDRLSQLADNSWRQAQLRFPKLYGIAAYCPVGAFCRKGPEASLGQTVGDSGPSRGVICSTNEAYDLRYGRIVS
jgi:hypothetical protein